MASWYDNYPIELAQEILQDLSKILDCKIDWEKEIMIINEPKSRTFPRELYLFVIFTDVPKFSNAYFLLKEFNKKIPQWFIEKYPNDEQWVENYIKN